MYITPVILSVGSGTRLWPLSRRQYPKQYLPLADDNTILQETILRLEVVRTVCCILDELVSSKLDSVDKYE